MYTVDDIVSNPVTYLRRSWRPAGPPNSVSEYVYSQEKACCFTTKDGKFTTGIPDADDCSYWRKTGNNVPLGHHSSDFVYCCDGGQSMAVNKLNKLLRR